MKLLDPNKTWSQRLERFFIFYLFANPVLDILNGMFIYALRQAELQLPNALASITITLILRIGILAMFAIYILMRRDKIIFYMSLIALAAVLSIYGEIIFAWRYNFFLDAQYIARFLYNVAALAVFFAMTAKSRLGRENMRQLLQRVFTWSATIMSVSIIIPYMLTAILPFRVGFFTYADRFGFRGASGFFHATNEAVSVLMLLLPIVFANFFAEGNYREKKNWLRLLAPAIVINTLILVGTKTAYAALIAVVSLFVIYQTIKAIRTKCKQLRIRLCQLFSTILAVLLFLSFFGLFGTLAGNLGGMVDIFEEEDQEFLWMDDEEQRMSFVEASPLVRLLLSGRQVQLMRTGREWAAQPYTVIFGVGRGSQPRVIEMDFFEILFYYGIFGAIVMLLPYLIMAKKFIKSLKGNRSLMIKGITLGLLLTLGYSFIAGHVFFSVMGGFYFVLIMIYGIILKDEDEQEGEQTPAPAEHPLSKGGEEA